MAATAILFTPDPVANGMVWFKNSSTTVVDSQGGTCRNIIPSSSTSQTSSCPPVFTSPDKVQAYTPNFTLDARFQWTEPTCNNNYRFLGVNVLSQQCCEKFVNVYQSAVIFNGNVEHYGACNTTEDTRVFMYIVLYSGRDDSN